MAEIKHTFQGGKMNKDLDERLVPQGEYRDALNIDVRTSDGSNAGAVQSLYGNKERLSASVDQFGTVNPTISWGGSLSTIVGSVAEEKTNKAYFFIASPSHLSNTGTFSVSNITERKLYKDIIVEYDNVLNNVMPLFTDVYRIEFTAADLGNIPGTGGSTYNMVTISGANAFENSMMIRPGMTIKPMDINGNSLISASPVIQPLNGLNMEIEVLKVDGLNVYFDRSVVGDLTNCVAWELKAPRVLKLTKNANIGERKIITGINVINNLLFWTDGFSEPKKVNIDRCKASVNKIANVYNLKAFDHHTILMVNEPDSYGDLLVSIDEIDVGTHEGIKEEHITVIKRAPRTAPNLEMSTTESGEDEMFSGNVLVGGQFIWDGLFFNPSGDLMSNGDTFSAEVEPGLNLSVGQVVSMESLDSDGNPASVRLLVEPNLAGFSFSSNTYSFTILAIGNGATAAHTEWTLVVEQRSPFFELVFGRFSYRYKYQDSEYSSFAPWSELAFLPSEFDYIPKKGYNLGMVNNIRNLRVTDFVPEDEQRPDDVIEVDILYKDTVSPNVYIVKSITRRDPEWSDIGVGSHKGVLQINSEMIHRTIASSQTLRAWDNVPRTAKAQEVTGNRLLYGNYLQNYDIKRPVHVVQNTIHESHPQGGFDAEGGGTLGYIPYKSLKSIRNYKIGVVFGDKYGRETPVIGMGGEYADKALGIYSVHPDSINVEKEFGFWINKLNVKLEWNGTAPESWMDYYKYYIKETTNEYYNLAMDKWYHAEDGNVWISFQSADRNKLDIETYLILKNEHGNNNPVIEKARYKILAIENEAPDFIKTTKRILGVAAVDPLTDLTDIAGIMAIKIADEQWGQFQGTTFKGVGWARIRAHYSGNVRYSNWIRIARLRDSSKMVELIEPLGASANIYNSFGLDSATNTGIDYLVEVMDGVVENRPEFDGRFFVKLFRDGVMARNILSESTSGMKYNAINGFHIAKVDSTDGVQNNVDTSAAYSGNYQTLPEGETPQPVSSEDWSDYMWNHYALEYPWSMEYCDHRDETKEFWKHMAGASTSPAKNKWFLDKAYAVDPDDQGNAGSGYASKGLFYDNSDDSPNVSGKNAMQLSVTGNSHDNHPDWDPDLYPLMTLEGTLFRFGSDPFGVIYRVSGYKAMWTEVNYHKKPVGICRFCDGGDHDADPSKYDWACRRRTFITYFHQENDINKGLETNIWDPNSALRHDGRNLTLIEIVKPHYDLSSSIEFAQDNAIWETEPKEDVDLDLYYEASNAIPLYLNEKNAESYIPVGSHVKIFRDGVQVYVAGLGLGSNINTPLLVHSIVGDVVSVRLESSTTVVPLPISIGDVLHFVHMDGTVTQSTVLSHWGVYNSIDDLYEPVSSFTHHWSWGSSSNTASDVQVFDSGPASLMQNQAGIYNEDSGLSSGLWDVSCSLLNPAIWVAGFMVSPATLVIENGTFVDSLNGSSVDQGNVTLSTYANSGATLQTINSTESIYQVPPYNVGSPDSHSLTFTKITGYYRLDYKTFRQPRTLSWFNCYSFGNGLESDRIRDDYNSPTIDNGCKVSTTLDTYGEELRSSGMIYSGIYNSTSGVNDLNEFNMSQSITKDLNPSYGSIQALYTRDTNVVAFCEDKVYQILANKDSLYNADGSSNVTASNAVLGDAKAFAGDYGISLNPESLAADGYRMYFTDKQRNKVLRLSMDGLTPISDAGMTSYFRDELGKSDYLIGSFDEIKSEYNLSLIHKDVIKSGLDVTVSFNEKTRGWSSFKSFIQETGLSINDEYITGSKAKLWSHHTPPDNTGLPFANNFYGDQYTSTIDVLFNEIPGSVKAFSTINYEGTQAKTIQFLTETVQDAAGNTLSNISDGDYYNLTNSNGWYVESFNTDLQEARVGEFIEKEGKWFNHINGIATTLSNLDEREFTVQGIGLASDGTYAPPAENFTLTIIEDGD